MITTTTNFDTENAKKTNEPVWIATFDYDYKNARISSSSDWQDASASGDADETTVAGSIICKTANTDRISESSYGSTTEANDGIAGYGIRIKVKHKFHLNSFKLAASADSSTSVICDLYAITDGLEDVVFSNSYTRGELLFTSTDTYNSGAASDHNYAPDVDLYPGTYLIRLNYSDARTITFNTWFPNEVIFAGYLQGAGSTLEGFEDGAYELGQVEFLDSDIDAYYLGNLPAGYIALKEFKVNEYQNSTHTTKFARVNDSSGNASAPTSSGTLFLEQIQPLGTSISITHVYGDADGSAGSEVDLGAKVDGDSITAYPYYKFDISLTTTKWWATPQLDEVEVYFPLQEKVVLSDQKFSTYRPIVADVPSLETIIDPIESKASISEPVIDIAIHRVGQNKTLSWIEDIVDSYYLTGGQLTIKYGFKKIQESDFIAYQTGIINNADTTDEFVSLVCQDTLQLSRDPLLVDSTISPAPSTYAYEHPCDIIYDMLSRLKVPDRSITESELTTIKTSLSGWQFFRVFKENELDVKKLLNEVCKLAQIVIINQEDGKLHFKWLNETFSSVFAFTDNNSRAVGKCKLNQDKRINVCSVQRGFWNESTYEEARGVDKQMDVDLDETSIVNLGRGKNVTIENKWIPRDIKVSTKYISLIVAENYTNLFGQGQWILQRETSHQYMHLQVGDHVTVETDQILAKGISGTVTKNGMIVRKKPNPIKRTIMFDIFLLTPWA